MLLCCSFENLSFLSCYYSQAASMVEGMAPLSKTAIMLGELWLETESNAQQCGAPLNFSLSSRTVQAGGTLLVSAPPGTTAVTFGMPWVGEALARRHFSHYSSQSCFGVSNVQAAGTVLGLAPLSNTAITFGVLWLGEKGVEHTPGRWLWLAVFSGSLALWQAALFLHSRPDWLASLVAW